MTVSGASPDPLRDLNPANTGSRPVPDPTELTDKAIAKAVVLLTQYVDGKVDVITTRMDGADVATELRLQTIDHIPGLIEKDVSHLELLHNERFDGVQTQFKERDTRSENEKREGQKSLDAALTAQKEQAASENKSFREAIAKSEASTTETIKTNQDLNRATTDNISKQLDELKTQVTRIESTKVGVNEQRGESAASRAAIYATVGLVISVILVCITVLGAIAVSVKP